MKYGTDGDDSGIGAGRDDFSASDFDVLEVAGPVDTDAFAARVSDRERFAVFECGEHKIAELSFVCRCSDHHSGDIAHESEVEDAVMSNAVFADDTGAVETEDDRELLNCDIVNNVVVGALDERGVDVAEWDESCGGETGRESNSMTFSDTDIETSVGEMLLKDIH